MIEHMAKPPFMLICWEKNKVNRIRCEQQTKADMFIKNHIQKVEFKDQEKNQVLTVPDEVRNVQGFTAIPPYLRVFPSKLSLQNINKKKYEENNEESDMLKIKNKRDIEDKIVDITLNENAQKSKDDAKPLDQPIPDVSEKSKCYMLILRA